MKLKIEFFVVVIAISLLNVSLLNCFFYSIHIPAWKQIIATIMLFCTFPYLCVSWNQKIRFICYIIFAFFFLSLFHDDLDILMAGYRYSGYGVFIFLIYLLYKDNTDFRYINKYLFALSFIISIGIIFDFNFNFLDQFKSVSVDAYEANLEENGFNRRVSLFLGSSSLVFMALTYSFLIRVVLNNKIFKIDLVYMATSIFSIYLSGSRLSLIMAFLLYGFIYITFSRSINIKLMKTFLLLVFSIIISLFVYINLSDNLFFQRIFDLFSPDDRGNVGRLIYYNWFFSNFLDFKLGDILIGHGLGFLSSSGNYLPSKHFESSFISIFIESGMLGLGLFLVLIWIVFSVSKNKCYQLFLCLILVNFLLVPSWLNYTVMFILSYLYCFFFRHARRSNVK